MAGWYKDRVRDHIDVNQAVRDAGKMSEAVATIAKIPKQMADEKYAKKQAKLKLNLENRKLTSAQDVANINAKGKTDTANISAGAKDRATLAGLKEHNIDFDRAKYTADSDYRKTMQGKLLDIKKQKIATGGTLGAASIRAGASRYSADRGVDGKVIAADASKYSADRGVDGKVIVAGSKDRETVVKRENNINTNTVNNVVSQRSRKTQLDVANINAKTAKSKAKAKKNAKVYPRLNLSVDDSPEETLKKLTKKSSSNIGKQEI